MARIIQCREGWRFSAAGGNETTVSLPHTAFLEPDTMCTPTVGECVYRYEFDAPEEWRKKIVYFEIGAAMQRTKVYVNGCYLFTHCGGYQKFFIPLQRCLKFGEKNELKLELDNAPTGDMPPGKAVGGLDFCYYSGLYRDANIYVYDPVHISDELAVSIPADGGVFIRPESVSADAAFLAASCHVMYELSPEDRWQIQEGRTAESEVRVELRIFAPCGSCVFAANSESVSIRPNCDHTFRIGATVEFPRLWTPAAPTLYRAEFKVFHNGAEVDRRIEQFGIRTIEFKREGFFLNGVKTPLFGTNRHSEFPFVGNGAPDNAQVRDALLIKEGGYNFVRLSHYNQSPAFIEACDRIGLMVMPAIPGWQEYHENGTFIQNALRDCRELVRSLRNHPCVVLWEVSLNEAYPPAWINEQFHRLAHEEYPGPFCFSAGDTWGLYEGWDVLFTHDHLENKEKPLLPREYGDWAFGGADSTSRHRRGDGVKAMLQQAWNFQWTFNRVLAMTGAVGGADWCFLDYNRGCRPGWEASGCVDLYRVPRPKYYFYRSQACAEPMIYAIHDGDSKLIVYSNCEEVELLRNGRSVLRRGPDDGPDSPYSDVGNPAWETALPGGDLSGGHPFDGGNVSHLPHPPYTFGNVPEPEAGECLTLAGYVNGAKVAETSVRKPGEAVRAGTRLRTEGIDPVPGDLVFADVMLLDAAGVIVPERRNVKLEIARGAEIVGGMTETEAGIASFLLRTTGGPVEIHGVI